ncbi:MAG: GNAT family N-acetyltransferase [Anaerolineae bacterium]|jgi:L-amino acid N-acyltransferase YncA|nr:GNAT family N-acetyltransferase [Anaerolineae bacterium]MDH7472744.1 GNAT family N-acetyltransferase [Anaerolineae bacterium]
MELLTTSDGRPLVVRPAAPSDAPLVIAVVDAVCRERRYMMTERFLPGPEWQEALGMIPRSGWKLLLVAECEGRIVGWCRAFADTVSPFARHTAEVGIGILKPYREIGIGTHLLRQTIQGSREAHLEKLTAAIFAINERALNLFIGRGFRVTGRRYRQFNLDGRYIDELLLERFL